MCVCVCVCVRQGRTVIRQLIPAAALLGQCAIISFIIITACSSSSALPPHASYAFLPPLSSSHNENTAKRQKGKANDTESIPSLISLGVA